MLDSTAEQRTSLMARLILTRLVTLIPLMFLITSIVFFMVRFVPGDPARIMVGGQRISEQNLANIRSRLPPGSTTTDAVPLVGR